MLRILLYLQKKHSLEIDLFLFLLNPVWLAQKLRFAITLTQSGMSGLCMALQHEVYWQSCLDHESTYR